MFSTLPLRAATSQAWMRLPCLRSFMHTLLCRGLGRFCEALQPDQYNLKDGAQPQASSRCSVLLERSQAEHRISKYYWLFGA